MDDMGDMANVGAVDKGVLHLTRRMRSMFLSGPAGLHIFEACISLKSLHRTVMNPTKPSTGEAVTQCVGKAQGLMITEMELAGEE